MADERHHDKRSLVNRLRGIYTVPVNDGAGLLDGKDHATRKFEMPPICGEAAARIEELEREVEQFRSNYTKALLALSRLAPSAIAPTKVRWTPALEVSEVNRKKVWASGLGNIGDALLVWVNEGDIIEHGERIENDHPREERQLAPASAAPAIQGSEPVAWLWEYVGTHPYAKAHSPVARSLKEMNPAAPEYPDTWKPLRPLYDCAPSSIAPSIRERDLAMMIRRLAARLRIRATGWTHETADYSLCDSAHDLLVKHNIDTSPLRDEPKLTQSAPFAKQEKP